MSADSVRSPLRIFGAAENTWQTSTLQKVGTDKQGELDDMFGSPNAPANIANMTLEMFSLVTAASF
jgi:hypothetical protein